MLAAVVATDQKPFHDLTATSVLVVQCPTGPHKLIAKNFFFHKTTETVLIYRSPSKIDLLSA